ncbi:MAG: winged helix-turn-helix transcriptional regulator [Candidatus Aquicultorales bacterium]
MNQTTTEADALKNLRLLEEIENNPRVSQRELSQKLGIALGLTNSLLKALVRKGLIKVKGTNNRSITYHLTHAGLLAKGQLAVKWTLNTIEFYRQARQNIHSQLGKLTERNVKRIALFGVSELTEIATIVAPETGLKIIGIVSEQEHSDQSVLGYTCLSIEQVAERRPDAVVLCVRPTDIQLDGLSKRLNTAFLLRLL